MKKLFAGLVLGLLVLTTGCAQTTGRSHSGSDVDVVYELRKAREHLLDNLITPLSYDKPLIAASFANIDDLTLSSTFGRMASEVVSAGMTDIGLKVIEVKMRDSLFIKQGAGEFMLSRQIQNISQAHNAQAVLLGTYAIGGNNLYVNIRLVRSADNIVIGSHDFQLPINRDIKQMLGRGRR